MSVKSVTVIEATEDEIDVMGLLVSESTSPGHVSLGMLCAVARAPDGDVLLTVFENGAGCSVQLSPAQAAQVAAQLTGRTQ
jgi:hypothetical protein